VEYNRQGSHGVARVWNMKNAMAASFSVSPSDDARATANLVSQSISPNTSGSIEKKQVFSQKIGSVTGSFMYKGDSYL